MENDYLSSYLKKRSLIAIIKYYKNAWYLPKNWDTWDLNLEGYLSTILSLDDKYRSRRQKNEIFKLVERKKYLDVKYENKNITKEEDSELTGIYRVWDYSVDDENIRFCEYSEWCELYNQKELLGGVQLEYLLEGHAYHMSEDEIEQLKIEYSSEAEQLPYDDYTPEGMGMDDYDEDNKRGP